MYYPEEVIEEVRSRSDIVAVVSARVRLSKRGSDYWGCCPFHNEKTPSFKVSPSRQMYHCFGCGAGGNVISFLMAYDNSSFQEALEQLAGAAGITLPQREQSESEKQEESLRTRLLEINAEAARRFFYQLREAQGEQGRKYLEGRGLSRETMRRFGLGYAVPEQKSLFEYLRSKGFREEDIQSAGLARIRERGASDMFRERVIYPIMDRRSRVIGFGGRLLGPGEPKYLNSPQTPVFDKRRNLYGLHLARASRRGYFILCEGYMDVIALHQAGFDCAVATLGTALTPEQTALLKRYTTKIILTYDSDAAGVKAAMRAIPLLLDEGIEVKVLNMRPYKDPDECIVHEGAEAFEERIAKADNYFLYQTDVWKQAYDLQDPTERTAYHRKLAEELSRFDDRLERDNYLASVCARQGIAEAPLREMMDRIGNRRAGQPKPAPADPDGDVSEEQLQLKQTRADGGLVAAEQTLLAWACSSGLSAGQLSSLLREEDFRAELHRAIFRRILADREAGRKTVPAALVSACLENEEEARQTAAVFTHALPEDLSAQERARILTENLRRLRRRSLDEALREAAGDPVRMQKIIREMKELPRLTVAVEKP